MLAQAFGDDRADLSVLHCLKFPGDCLSLQLTETDNRQFIYSLTDDSMLEKSILKASRNTYQDVGLNLSTKNNIAASVFCGFELPV